nr:hypothetical protein CFP56_41419 [Quercus suber]
MTDSLIVIRLVHVLHKSALGSEDAFGQRYGDAPMTDRFHETSRTTVKYASPRAEYQHGRLTDNIPVLAGCIKDDHERSFAPASVNSQDPWNIDFTYQIVRTVARKWSMSALRSDKTLAVLLNAYRTARRIENASPGNFKPS